MSNSQYIHQFSSPHTRDVALYHRLSMDIIYYNPTINPATLPIDDDGYRATTGGCLYTDIQPEISVMYLLLTDNCTLRCRYCTVQYNLEDAPIKVMDEATIKKSIQLFKKLSPSGKKASITFFGGEPTLNPDGLQAALIEISRVFAQDEIQVFMVSNGTVITERIADMLVKYQVFPIISIDGWQEIHDRMRVHGNGNGSYQDAIAGYNRLKDKGLNVGISTLVGKHNCEHLPEIVSFFIHELSAFNLGMSLPHVQPEAADISIELLTPKLIGSWEIARDNNFYIMQIGKRLKALAQQKPILRSCPGSSGWSMIRILPNGTITLCENMGLRNKAVLGNVNQHLTPENIINHTETIDWNKRHPYNINSCMSCPAISICGGGCPYDAFLETGSIHNPEQRSCYLSNHLLEWAIWDIYKRVDMSQGFAVPTREQRQGILPEELPYFISDAGVK
ncbi:radical SAM protein [Candidatus Desantisbacteria bacterium]|nr:radical SAM protein [Candidatus Desantisbacteria bacterium]